ncbi:peptidase MA family metallohydrolase [Serpentinicella sp. ANB-PHB4]|uniref:peptidase MA family metallohydrolase n=1 Tax=Serpentinicella sp. ANB-PHB4 TaxID=3074076 RepID=UPI00285862C2|nr:peptidase MA family metallohydrolase [Serpentinicella sp. ANB-PHB4]MDR5658871.1 peptidase MA family metallohydrolase [Serpentinicella sp. ANB-PHB4]
MKKIIKARYFKNHRLVRMIILSMALILFVLSSTYSNGWTTFLRPGVRLAEQAVVAYKTNNYSELETNNFIVRYRNTNHEIVNLVANTAESKYKVLADIFSHEFNNKIRLIIYEDQEDMMNATLLKGERAPMGVYFGNTIHVHNPSKWIEEEADMESIFYSEGPVLHELAHLFTDHLARGNYPTWFTEGVSLYFEYSVDGYEWGKGVDIDEDIYTIKNLTERFHELDTFNAYTQSFRLVKGFVNQNGEDALIELIRSLGKGYKLDIKLFI